MKNHLAILSILLFIFLLIISCGINSSKESTTSNEVNQIDICRCLTEPGNSEWMNQNKVACRDVISKELGVENYEKVNFSKEPELNHKWEQLVEKCSGNIKFERGEADNNIDIIKQIGTSYGFIWESINTEAQLYTTLAFDEVKFRTSCYEMNGQSNSENFTLFMKLSGTWRSNDQNNAEGTYDQNNVNVNWTFAYDYSYLTNNKGVVFNRIKVR
jgi:hypothetical protein